MNKKTSFFVLIAAFAMSISCFGGSKADSKSRKPANALSIDLTGYYISPSNDNATFELQGKNLKTHLTSRFSDAKGKPIALKVKLECADEDNCALLLSQ